MSAGFEESMVRKRIDKMLLDQHVFYVFIGEKWWVGK